MRWWIYLLIGFSLGFLVEPYALKFFKTYNTSQKMQKELVYLVCEDGVQVAKNNNGYRRVIMDENNKPLRCQ